jgi:hypothetical protein
MRQLERMSAAPFNIVVVGQHYLCRYGLDPALSNGDLVAGKVVSVPGDGTVILANLLTGSTSKKQITGLRRRNWQCPPRFTALVVERFQQAGGNERSRLSAARQLAVELHREARE